MRGRLGAAIAGSCLCLVLVASRADAQTDSSSTSTTATVRISASTDGFAGCGNDTDPTVTFERSGSASAALDVAYTYGATTGDATFASGAATVVVTLPLTSGELALSDGPDYDLGDPSSAFIGVAAAACAAPPGLLRGAHEAQTIFVGDQPGSLELAGLSGVHIASVSGDVPGLTLHPDGSWSGVATTTGTYDLTLTICDDRPPSGLCTDDDTVRITVLPEGLARTGAPPMTPWLALIGLGLIAAGIGLRKMAGGTLR